MQVLAAALEPDRMAQPKPHAVSRAKTMELGPEFALPPGVSGPFANPRPSIVLHGCQQPRA